MKVAVIHGTYGVKALGLHIRVEKIIDSLRGRFEVLDVHLPSITREYLSKYDGLKNIVFNILPLQKLVTTYQRNESAKIISKVRFSILLNYLTKTLKEIKPHVLLAETSTIGWIASVAAKELSLPCIIDVHGLGFAEAKGWNRKNWEQIKNIEIQAFKNCDYLIVVSERMKEYLSKELRLSKNKMVVAPNGSLPQKLVAEYETPLKVIYSGAFAYYEKVQDFLEMAKRADSSVFNFYLAGAGELGSWLLTRIKRERIPITYLGYVPRQKIHALLSKMQIGIATSTRDLARQVASPIKIYDYMASGLPVITPQIGDWGDMINKENCGMALKEDTIENYLEALNVVTSQNTWVTMSRNAVKAIKEKYSWDKSLYPIVDLIQNCDLW